MDKCNNLKSCISRQPLYRAQNSSAAHEDVNVFMLFVFATGHRQNRHSSLAYVLDSQLLNVILL